MYNVHNTYILALLIPSNGPRRWRKHMGAVGHQLLPVSQVTILAIVARTQASCLHSQVMFWKCRVMPLHLHPLC